MTAPSCTVRRCCAPASWRVTSSRTSPLNGHPFAAAYCNTHAGQLLRLPSTVSAARIETQP